MRTALVLLLALGLFVATGRAEEAEVPIRVEKLGSLEATADHLTFIRDWLRSNVHPTDLAGAEVVIELRSLPPFGYCALATLTPHDRGTWRVERRICLRHPDWGRGHLRENSPDAPWTIRDRYRVLRIYEFGETKKVLRQLDRMSYRETRSILKAVHEHAVDLPDEALAGMPPFFAEVTSIDRHGAGRYEIRTTDADRDATSLRGHYYIGTLQSGRFVVAEAGFWVS